MSPPLLWPPRGEGEAHASALQARRRPAGRFWKGCGARPTGRTGRRTLGTLGSPALVPRRLERQQGCDSHVGAPAPVTSRPLGDFRVHALREGGVGAAQNPRRGRCVAGPWARPHPLSHAAASGGTSPSLRSREQTGEGCGREARGVSGCPRPPLRWPPAPPVQLLAGQPTATLRAQCPGRGVCAQRGSQPP